MKLKSVICLIAVAGAVCHYYAQSLVVPASAATSFEELRGGGPWYCAVPYPTYVGGCNACIPDGTKTDPISGIVIPVWKTCSAPEGDQKCMTHSSFTTTKCDKTSTACGGNFQHYRDAMCSAILTNYTADLCNLYGFTYDKATASPQTGVNCSGVTYGIY